MYPAALLMLRYMEISMYLNMCNAEKYMEMSMYKVHGNFYVPCYIAHAKRYMEISMYPATLLMPKGTWKFPWESALGARSFCPKLYMLVKLDVLSWRTQLNNSFSPSN